MSRAFLVSTAAIVCIFVLGCGPAEPVFEPEIPELPLLPEGLDESLLRIPEDNPQSPEKVALGWQLYYDPRLSADESLSCSSCHLPDCGFGDPDPVSTGVGGAKGRRNSSPVTNAAFNATQFWDGRAESLEAQALGPIQDPVEMANTLEAVVARLNEVPGYRNQFATVFGDDQITPDRIAKAIAAFERTVLSGNSAWDQWLATRDEAVVSEAARRGNDLFMGKAGCSQCHVGTSFTDSPFGIYHNIGVGMDSAEPDLGRFEVTGNEADKGAFKTPTLRDITESAPYMHDGSIATLEDVIEFYDRGGTPNEWLDPKMKPLGLSAEEKQDLLEFMKALRGDVPEFATQTPALPPDVQGSD